MIRGIYTAVSGLITQEAKQDVITNNLANVNTVGYKKDDLIAKKFDDVMIENRDKVVDGKNTINKIGNLSLGCGVDETYTNFSQGSLDFTDKKTDFAIRGNGFFVVSRYNDGINGQNCYTRDGHFHLNSQGYLVSDSGDKVLGRSVQNGRLEPIRFQNGDSSAIACSEDGTLSMNGVPQYKIYTVDFNDYKSLKKLEENVYTGGNPRESMNSQITQGALEKSNINVMNEVSNMMMTMRCFESNQKIVQTIDDTLGKTVNEVGRI